MRGCLSRIRGSESAQLAQYAAVWDRTALRKPNPPSARGRPTVAPSQSLRYPTTPGYNSTRSHREQQRIALTKQVAPPEGSSWPAWQHKTTAEATTGDLAQQESCGTELSAPLSWPAKFQRRPQDNNPLLVCGQSLIAFPHHCVGVCDSCFLEDAFTTGWASTTLVPDLRLPTCNEIPARVHNWCPNSRCTIVVSGCETRSA